MLTFLDNREAVQEFSNAPYFKNFRHRELLVRLASFYPQAQLAKMDKKSLRDLLFNVYLNSTRDFDSVETEALQLYFNEIERLVKAKGGGRFFLPSNQPIGLVKMEDHGKRLDWGYLFTINSTIVIPVSYLNFLVDRYRTYLRSTRETAESSVSGRQIFGDKSVLQAGINNLYHETVHILQRQGDVLGGGYLYDAGVYSCFFGELYRNLWDMEKVERNQLKGIGLLDQMLTFISNPDGPNFRWITRARIGNKYQYLLPALRYNASTGHPEGVLIVLEPLPFGEYSATTSVYSIESVPDYSGRFYGLKGQLYHPHEISAQLLSDYLVSDKLWGNQLNSFAFYQYLEKFLL